eukprot:SAG11_NODE_2896_length_2856_cov_92.166123_2_plen_113_part_00
MCVQLDSSDQDLFPRQLFVLRGKSKDDRETDEWSGKVKAVVKALDKNMASLEGKIADSDTKVEQIENQLGKKLTGVEEKVEQMDTKLDQIMAALDKLAQKQEKQELEPEPEM